MPLFEKLIESVIQGEEGSVRECVQQALSDHIPVKEILNDGLIKAINIVGEKFKKSEFYVPDVLWSAQAMKAGIELIQPFFQKSDVPPLAKVVIGTVEGDIHEIGKNLVAMMVEANGFEVINLGVDVPPERFVESVRAHQAKICMMSALLTTTMPTMKKIIEALKEAGLAGRVKTMVGGAPVTKQFALEIGADGYSPDAPGAAELAKEWIAG
ncbi:MAG: corrinoid protein [Syntrophaceae bacterium]|nr:corrinoid protein [Syntrophaceae bacterium]